MPQGSPSGRLAEIKRPVQGLWRGLEEHPRPPNRNGRRSELNWSRAKARRRWRPAQGGRLWMLVLRSAPANRNLTNEGWPTRAQTRLGACAPMDEWGLAAGRLPLPHPTTGFFS